MAHWLIAPVTGGALLMTAFAASAQPATPPPPPAPLAIANPSYVTMVMELSVDRPAAAVWARVGKFCDIAEWFRTTCTLSDPAQTQLGAVRHLNGGGVIEMMVAKTDLSYTYTQPVRTGVPFNAYHGTLEAKPVTATTSKLVYSFFYDNSMLASDAARATEQTNRRNRFMGGMQNMKILAEGGKLPPA
jgi:hypothetical protein